MKKNERDMFYENSGYFQTPNMPMMPNMNSGMSMPQTLPNYNHGNYPVTPDLNPGYQVNNIEQRLNRLERYTKRLDNRVSKLESMMNATNNYQMDNNDMYMI